MSMKRNLLLLAILFFYFITLNTNGAPPRHITLTLEDAVLLALRDNLDLQSKKLDRISEKYDIVVAKNEFEPKYSFDAKYDYERNKSDGTLSIDRNGSITPKITLKNSIGTEFSLTSENPITHPESEDTSYNPSLELSITQPLIRGFGKDVVKSALRNAFDREVQNKLSLKSSTIETINNVIDKYDPIRSKTNIKDQSISSEKLSTNNQ